MRVAAVDIGTNSMRLLIRDGPAELGRWQGVTGLGVGVDATGRLSGEGIERTVAVLGDFGERRREAQVARA
ncbi:MAG: exopolyphosphatase, partial [Acidimicrobiia bacterium]